MYLCCREDLAESRKVALDSQAKQLRELQDTNSSLKTDLQRAKSNVSSGPKLQERVSELESLVASMEQDSYKAQVRVYSQ